MAKEQRNNISVLQKCLGWTELGNETKQATTHEDEVKSAQTNDYLQLRKRAQHEYGVKTAQINDYLELQQRAQHEKEVQSAQINEYLQLLQRAQHENGVKTAHINDYLQLKKRNKSVLESTSDDEINVCPEESFLPSPAAEPETGGWWRRCAKGLLTAGLVVGIAVAGLAIAKQLTKV